MSDSSEPQFLHLGRKCLQHHRAAANIKQDSGFESALETEKCYKESGVGLLLLLLLLQLSVHASDTLPLCLSPDPMMYR